MLFKPAKYCVFGIFLSMALLVNCGCDPGTSFYHNSGEFVITLVADTTTCRPDEHFFYWIDNAILDQFSTPLPVVLYVDKGTHIIGADCFMFEGRYTWRDTLEATNDTTLIVTCERCK